VIRCSAEADQSNVKRCEFDRREIKTPLNVNATSRPVRAPMAIAILAYITVCLLTAFCGTHRRMGYWGTFFFALLTTPLVTLPVLFLTGPSRHVEWRPRE
jgi:hypothetical protein